MSIKVNVYKFYSLTIYYYIHSAEWVFVLTHKDTKSLSFGNSEKLYHTNSI